jgi:hypothetical protein
MKRIECPREADIVAAIAAGSWPERVDAELRAHADACASCADVAVVAPSLRDDYLAMSADVQLPAAGQVWWRAAVRARLEIAESAAQPITWMQGLAGAGAAGLLMALIGVVWPSLLEYAGWGLAALLPRTTVTPRIAAVAVDLLRQTLPLVIVVALCMLIAPVAVYLATSDE